MIFISVSIMLRILLVTLLYSQAIARPRSLGFAGPSLARHSNKDHSRDARSTRHVSSSPSLLSRQPSPQHRQACLKCLSVPPGGASFPQPSQSSPPPSGLTAAVAAGVNVRGGGAAAVTNKSKDGVGAPVLGSIFNIVKNILGAGTLALPGGVAAFSMARSATLPTALLISFMGMLSCYCFSLIGRTCAATGATSYPEAWALTVSKKTKWMVSGSVIFKTGLACLSYSIIIGDVLQSLATTFNAPSLLRNRNVALSLVSSGVVLPLCFLKNLAPLGKFSLLGLTGTLYTALVMVLRYFDGSYRAGGQFYNALAKTTGAALPAFGGSGKLNALSLILVSMLSTTFIAHYNAPKFYTELKDKSVPRFSLVVWPSFIISAAVITGMTVFPFLTFGGASAPFILNNYASSDMLATYCRLAIGVSILFGYPLTFIPVREGLLNALRQDPTDSKTVKVATVTLVAAFTGLAMVLQDLGLVVALGGAVLGSAVAYVFPALMWVRKCQADRKVSGKVETGWRRNEFLFNIFVIALGSVLGGLGAGVSVYKACLR